MRVPSRWKLPVALSITLLASACGLSDESGDAAIDSVRIANTVEVPSGTKLVVAEQNGTQSLPWNLANAGKDMRTIQDYLGHRDPKHTAHYTRTASHRFEGLWR